MRSFLIVLLTALPLAAAADTSPDVRKMASDDCAKARAAKKTCVLDIGPEELDGSVPTNSGSTIVIPPGGKAGSLIHIRRDFIVEILKSAEDL